MGATTYCRHCMTCSQKVIYCKRVALRYVTEVTLAGGIAENHDFVPQMMKKGRLECEIDGWCRQQVSCSRSLPAAAEGGGGEREGV